MFSTIKTALLAGAAALPVVAGAAYAQTSTGTAVTDKSNLAATPAPNGAVTTGKTATDVVQPTAKAPAAETGTKKDTVGEKAPAAGDAEHGNKAAGSGHKLDKNHKADKSASSTVKHGDKAVSGTSSEPAKKPGDVKPGETKRSDAKPAVIKTDAAGQRL